MADALAPLICDKVGNSVWYIYMVWYIYGGVYGTIASHPYRSEAGLESNHKEAPN